MEEAKIILNLSDEVNQLIKDKRFPLELKVQEIEGVEKIERQYYQVEGEPVTRDLSLVIITSAAAFYIVVKAISQLLETVKGGPVTALVDYMEPVETKSGEVIKDKDGNPIIHSTKRVVSGGTRADSNTIDIKGLFQLKDESNTNK